MYVRSVLVRGLDTTRPALVASRIPLAPGRSHLQARIAESQQKLYDLGIFSKVQTAIQNPDGEEDNKYVLFQLDEASKYSFNAGLRRASWRASAAASPPSTIRPGQPAFSPRVSVGISRLNFLGLGHTVSLQTLFSTLEQRAIFTYQAPQFTGNQNLTLTFSGLFDDSRDIRTFARTGWKVPCSLAQSSHA